MRRGTTAILLTTLLAAGCAGPAATPAPSPTLSEEPAIVLRTLPGGVTGCDAIGVDYRSVTFRIDPWAADQVTAVADTGTVLRTKWAPGFRPGAAGTRTILDPAGAIVARDGEEMANPADRWPDLHGWRVCPGPEQLSVLAVPAQGS